MARLHRILTLVLLTSAFSYAQEVDTLWTRSYFPCETWDEVMGLAEYPWRGLLVAGKTNCYDDVYLVNCGYVQRLDQSLFPIWTRTFGPDRVRLITQLVVTEDGRIVFVGSGRNGRERTYGALNEDGETLWMSPIGSHHEYNMGSGVCPAVDGGFIVVSTAEQEADSGQIMIEYISDSGAVDWTRFQEFSEQDRISDIERIGDMYVMLCSSTQENTSFLCAQFLSASGDAEGRIEIATATITHPQEILVIGDTLIAAMGTIWNSPGTNEQTMISVFDTQGNLQWSWTEDPTSPFSSSGMCATPSGGLIVCGSVGGTPQESAAALLKFSSSGQIVWDVSIESEFADQLNTVIAFGEEECVAGGQHAEMSNCYSYDDWLVGFGQRTNVSPGTVGVVKDLSLSAYPNPFNGTLSISLDVPLHQELSLGLYDLLGREVDTIYRGKLNNGTISYTAPMTLSSGIYFIRASAASQTAMQKVVLLK